MAEKYKELESKYTFYNNNGLDIFITLILFILIIGYAFYGILINLRAGIKSNWAKYHCNPLVIPLAGWIIQPDDMSQSKYTEYNYNKCTKGVIKNVANISLSPLDIIVSGFKDMFEYLANIAVDLTNVVGKLTNFLFNIFETILDIFFNIIDEVIGLGYVLGDIINRVLGVIFSAIDGCLTIFNIFGSLFSLFYDMLTSLLIIVISLAIAFFLIGIALVMSGIGAPWGLVYLGWFTFYMIFAIAATVGLIIARLILMVGFYILDTSPPPPIPKPK